MSIFGDEQVAKKLYHKLGECYLIDTSVPDHFGKSGIDKR